MHDHIGLNVSDLEASVRFYEAALEPLGFVLCSRDDAGAGFGPEGAPALWLSVASGRGARSGVHVAFRAHDRGAVEAFHKAGLGAGGRDHGEPGLRAAYGPSYYAAFLIDPDGNNVEAVCTRQEDGGVEARSSFLDALRSEGPAPERASELGLYAFLVGGWDTRILAYGEDGTRHESRGEIHAGWVLEGRAIQDVWMTPPRAGRRPGEPLTQLPVTGAWYGTTLRIYDPELGAWQVLWSDPATQFYARQIGRAEGDDIVQEGTMASGAVLRWRFTEIESDSFHWLGEISADGGATWRLQVEVFARRAAPA